MATYQPIAADANDLPINEIILNVEWAGLIIEHLTALQSSSAWSGTDAEIEHCISQIETAKDLLMGYDLIPPNIAFQAGKSADVTLSSGSMALLTMPTIQNNAGGYYNTGASRFTPLKTGRYKVWVNVLSDGTGQRILQVRKNGNVVMAGYGPQVSEASKQATISINGEVDMNGTTDYLELWAGNLLVSCVVTGVPTSTYWGARLVAW